MEDAHKQALEAVNASGFLFQLRVEQEIRGTYKRSGQHWSVLAREYRWRDPLTQEDKYADLILGRDVMRMVIECKRLQDTSWIFLQPKEDPTHRHAKLYWCHNQTGEPYLADWDDFGLDESYPHSEFCIQQTTRGQRGLVLEALAGELLRSVEYLAAEEGKTIRSPMGKALIYLPVIVTTAPLYAVSFQSSDVDLGGGILRGDHTELQNVPCVAFRKSLTTSSAAADAKTLRSKYDRDPNLALLNQDNARTAFVVNAPYLTEFLYQVHAIHAIRHGYEAPWDIARRLLRDSTGMDCA